MIIITNKGTRVEADIDPDALYVVCKLVKAKHIEAKIRIKIKWHSALIDVSTIDIEKTFSGVSVGTYVEVEPVVA